MGCINSKPAEADKDALQRNARIDRTIKNDKKVLDRTIKILLLGAWCPSTPQRLVNIAKDAAY